MKGKESSTGMDLNSKLEESTIWKLGADIDTDIIIPTEYLALGKIEDMKPYAFSPLRSELAESVKEGDVMVAGKNFGCGSSREQAPQVIKSLGIRCIIAESFSRIFYRNALNNGLLLIENEALARSCKEGGKMQWLDPHTIIYEEKKYLVPSFPEGLQAILEAGGIVPYWKDKNQAGEGEVCSRH